MKKYLFSALALGMMLTSCQSDEPFAPGEGGEKQVTFTLNVPGDLGTRAVSGESGAQNNENANIYYTLVLDANGDKQVLQRTTTDKTVTFPATVVLGRKYDITAYASYEANIDATASNIKAIEVEKSFNDETKDAYTAHVEDHDFALSALPTMQLKRPFGKLRLIATDYVETGTAKNTAIDQVTITYQNTTATTYDATTTLFNNVGTGISATKDFNKYYTDNTDGMPIFADYLPANREDNPITFTVTVRYADSTETYSRTFNDIPVRRNALTTLKGNFFTAGAEIKVEVKDNFEGGEFVSVATASQLQDAINKGGNGETIILTDDIVLTEPLVFSVNSSSSAPTRSGATNSFVLNLNGKNITGTDSGTASYGLITIKKGADLTIEGNGAISLTATQDRGWNAYSSVISNQQGKLTVNGGTIEHHGGTAMAYAIDNLTNGNLGEVECTINGGTIKSTYRAIRQFLNSNSCQNSLTVNGGTIESTNGNKSIWMQDASAKANRGTLMVYGDATINSNIYIDGNTAWDVDAYIEKTALKNNSTVISEGVPAGYSVIEENGVWKVVSIDEILEANFADNTWENIILACQSNCVPETWNVGDKKTMEIGNYTYDIAIIGKNHDTYTGGDVKAPLTFQLFQLYGTDAQMNETQDNTTGWSGSKMRNTTMAEILAAMPDEVKNAIKAVDKVSLNGSKSELETTSDKLFLLSEKEVNGSEYYSGGFEEGTRYAYYTNANSQIMKPSPNKDNKWTVSWYLRTPKNDKGSETNGWNTQFVGINGSGYMNALHADMKFGVVFGFCF